VSVARFGAALRGVETDEARTDASTAAGGASPATTGSEASSPSAAAAPSDDARRPRRHADERLLDVLGIAGARDGSRRSDEHLLVGWGRFRAARPANRPNEPPEASIEGPLVGGVFDAHREHGHQP